MVKENKNVANNKVILNSIQDLQRVPLLLRNSVRGRFQIKFGMTSNFKDEALNKGCFRAPLRSGFTLIELLVVALIIGILAAIALPQYQIAVEKSRVVQLLVSVKSLAEAEEAYYLANGKYTEYFKALDIGYDVNADTWTLQNGTILTLAGASNWIIGRTKHVEIIAFTQHGMGQSATWHKPGMMICATSQEDKIGMSICKGLSGGTIVQNRYMCSFGLCTSYLLRH